MKTILTIDDEEHILELLKYNIENNGYKVIQASSAKEGLEILEKETIDLILLDIMMPEMDGLECLREIKSKDELKRIPVIMLTAKSEEIDTVLGLEMGADDYMKKPFGIHELMARVKTAFRRIKNSETGLAEVNQEKDEILSSEGIEINKTKYTLTVNGQMLTLPHKEFELLYFLLKNRGRVFDREYLLEKIWGYEYYGETRTVDVHIRNIRKKIEVDDKAPQYIKTVRGVGYKFS